MNAKFLQGSPPPTAPSPLEIYDAYKALFAALPLAVRTPNRVYVCHTIPDATRPRLARPRPLKADAWPEPAMKRRGTIYALTWGRDTSPETADRFAAMVDADFFITGHQPCDEGFRQANHRQIIIDGTNPYPCYCLFPATGPVTIESLLKCVHSVDVLAV